MIPKLKLSTFLFFSIYSLNTTAQNIVENDPNNPCISSVEYATIEKRCKENSAKFIHISAQRPQGGVLLNWPLRAASGFTDCSFYYISAHVDMDNTTAFKDYNCGTITYNGHHGSDIATGPFGFFKMDNSQVEVIAAAAGTIIDKHDGEYDRNCVGVGSNLTANYVILSHADGSYTLYWHMKSGKVTKKAVGQTVASGEYLGVVGSSGSASGPHLHFEVWTGSSNTTYIDPFSGPCNTVNLISKWVSQKPYTEPAINKAGVFTTDYIQPACGTTETVNESSVFVTPFQGTGLAPGYAKFYIFVRNPTAGTSANLSILNPDGTVFASTPPWIQNFSSTLNFGIYGGPSKKLPTTSGIYTFKAEYNGIVCSQQFEIRTCAENYNAWTGVTSTDWATPGNWSCGVVPNSSTNVIIYAGVPNLPIVSSAAECSSLKSFSSSSVKVNTGSSLKVYH